jgi:chromosome segregation ATPase
VGSLSAQLAEHVARLHTLEAELEARAREQGEASTRHHVLQQELTESNTALTQRTAVLQEKLAADRAESSTRGAALQRAEDELARQAQQLAAAARREQELQAELDMQVEAMRTLQEELQSRVQRAHAGETDLRAAEESVRRLRGELAAREARIEELNSAWSEMQGQVAAARIWLDERDALMQRLESEAANSAVLVQNLQRSLGASQEAQGESARHLLIRTDDGHEATHELGPRTCIGRTPDNDIQVEATHVSRHHALVLCGADGAVIQDLNSTNGVQVNGRRVARARLQDGDSVLVGRAKFRFVLRQP